MEVCGDKSVLSRIALLGGSFNPLHYGHLRLAVEVVEALAPDRLDFIPCANPPHKRRCALLPFDLRARMLEAVCAGHKFFSVNRLECLRNAPSYTCETLEIYRNMYPEAELFFVVGAGDFSVIDTWKNWQALPNFADLLVVERAGKGKAPVTAAVRRLWPGAKGRPVTGSAGSMNFAIPGSGNILFMPLPRLDVNASLVRARWLSGRDLSYWVPEQVLELLAENTELAQKHWRNSWSS